MNRRDILKRLTGIPFIGVMVPVAGNGFGCIGCGPIPPTKAMDDASRAVKYTYRG